MVFSLAVRTDISEGLKAEYAAKLASMSMEELVKEFFSYLDYREYKGMDDHEVQPISISCGRVLMGQPLGMCLKRMREQAKV